MQGLWNLVIYYTTIISFMSKVGYWNVKKGFYEHIDLPLIFHDDGELQSEAIYFLQRLHVANLPNSITNCTFLGFTYRNPYRDRLNKDFIHQTDLDDGRYIMYFGTQRSFFFARLSISWEIMTTLIARIMLDILLGNGPH